MKTPILVSAEDMARQHPDRFHRPPPVILKIIGVGDIVKVCDNRERFWVVVTHRKGNIITGEVNNHLIHSPLKVGEKIRFHIDNVYDVYSKEVAR